MFQILRKPIKELVTATANRKNIMALNIIALHPFPTLKEYPKFCSKLIKTYPTRKYEEWACSSQFSYFVVIKSLTTTKCLGFITLCINLCHAVHHSVGS